MGTMRAKEIDGLTSMRGVAALLVVMFHLIFLGDLRWVPLRSTTPFFSSGHVWVDFFFLLSGFVIAHVYGSWFGSGISGVALKQFFVARVARIYPLHLVMLVVVFLVEIVKFAAVARTDILPLNPPFGDGKTLDALVYNLLLIQAWGFFAIPTWNEAAWSISVEFAAYLAFPFVFLAACRANRWGRALLLAVLCIPLVAFSLRYSGSLDGDFRFFFPARGIAEFAIGVGLWALYRSGSGIAVWRQPIVGLGAGAAALVVLAVGLPQLILLPLFSIVILAIACENRPITRVLATPLLMWLGRISYSIYLSHALVLTMIDRLLKAIAGPGNYDRFSAVERVVITVAAIALVLVVAESAYRFVEWPARRAVRARFGNISALPMTVETVIP